MRLPTKREQDIAHRRRRVADLTLAGLSAAQIAKEIGISQRSVVRHREVTGVHGGGKFTPPYITPEMFAEAYQLLLDGAPYSEASASVGMSETHLRKKFPGMGWSRPQCADWSRVSKKVDAVLGDV